MFMWRENHSGTRQFEEILSLRVTGHHINGELGQIKLKNMEKSSDSKSNRKRDKYGTESKKEKIASTLEQLLH